MKRSIHIGFMLARELPPGTFEQLAAIYPAGVEGQGFGARLAESDGRIAQILDVLERSGMPRFSPFEPFDFDKRKYSVSRTVEYEQSDVEHSKLVRICPLDDAAVGSRFAYGRDETGMMEVDEALLLGTNADLLLLVNVGHFVTRRAKGAFEASNLRGVRFLPTRFVPESVQDLALNLAACPTADDSPYWEIDSDLMLPPASPMLDVVDARGNKLIPGATTYSNGFLFREPNAHTAQMRYRRSDLDAFGPFDLARAYEVFQGGGQVRQGKVFPPRYSQPLIASARFYQTCRDAGLRADFEPVQIDGD